MAVLRPPHLKAMFANKGGFYSAWDSGVRNGGAYEARQWIWGVKQAPRKDPIHKEALESVDKNFGAWLKRFPFKRGDSPLAASPEYENFIFDQSEAREYGPYWKQIGMSTAEHLDDFADIPVLSVHATFSSYRCMYARTLRMRYARVILFSQSLQCVVCMLAQLDVRLVRHLSVSLHVVLPRACVLLETF
jgi:predicted acyl esterase